MSETLYTYHPEYLLLAYCGTACPCNFETLTSSARKTLGSTLLTGKLYHRMCFCLITSLHILIYKVQSLLFLECLLKATSPNLCRFCRICQDPAPPSNWVPKWNSKCSFTCHPWEHLSFTKSTLFLVLFAVSVYKCLMHRKCSKLFVPHLRKEYFLNHKEKGLYMKTILLFVKKMFLLARDREVF